MVYILVKETDDKQFWIAVGSTRIMDAKVWEESLLGRERSC